MERSPRPVSRQNTLDYDDGASCMGRSYNDMDFVMEEAGGLQRLRIDDSMRRSDGYSLNSAAGQKRRASSPLVDEMHQTLHPTNSMSDLRRRRESAASRAFPSTLIAWICVFHGFRTKEQSFLLWTNSGKPIFFHASNMRNSQWPMVPGYGYQFYGGNTPSTLNMVAQLKVAEGDVTDVEFMIRICPAHSPMAAQLLNWAGD